MTYDPDQPFYGADGHGFDGHDGQAVNFDYDAVDCGNPLTAELEESPSAKAGYALESLLAWIWENPNFKLAFVRFVAVSAVMRPELLDNQSYHELAHKMNITKATLSHSAREFQDLLGAHFRRSRRESGREAMRAERFKAYGNSNGKFLKPIGK